MAGVACSRAVAKPFVDLDLLLSWRPMGGSTSSTISTINISSRGSSNPQGGKKTHLFSFSLFMYDPEEEFYQCLFYM